MDLLIASSCLTTRCWKVLSESVDAWLGRKRGLYLRPITLIFVSVPIFRYVLYPDISISYASTYIVPSPKHGLRKVMHVESCGWWVPSRYCPVCGVLHSIFITQVLVSPRLLGRDLLHWWWRHRVWQRGKCKANRAWICASRHGRSLGWWLVDPRWENSGFHDSYRFLSTVIPKIAALVFCYITYNMWNTRCWIDSNGCTNPTRYIPVWSIRYQYFFFNEVLSDERCAGYTRPQEEVNFLFWVDESMTMTSIVWNIYVSKKSIKHVACLLEVRHLTLTRGRARSARLC